MTRLNGSFLVIMYLHKNTKSKVQKRPIIYGCSVKRLANNVTFSHNIYLPAEFSEESMEAESCCSDSFPDAPSNPGF